jgi:hypothetical protein
MSITLAPDIFGYVSSCTRDNPYFTDGEPSYLSGLERAKAMRNVRVIIGEVGEVPVPGHIAFATTVDARPLQKGRLYN